MAATTLPLSEYELEREARIARNRKRLEELSIPKALENLNAFARRNLPKKSVRQPQTLKVLKASGSSVEKRRSGRLANQPAVEYSEADLDRIERSEGPKLFRGTTEEVYTEGHVRLLGTSNKDWVLFQDGYAADGSRIYSKEAGMTCHQCRQKTLGLRTTCSACNSLKGVFCGDCLFMRYGENVEEANANKDWVCPDCRGICNCSIHRIRKGWAPTGSMYRQAIAQDIRDTGYKSVAHYIILTNLAKSGAPEAATVDALLVDKEQNGSLSKPKSAEKMAVQKEITDILLLKRKGRSKGLGAAAGKTSSESAPPAGKYSATGLGTLRRTTRSQFSAT